jgi:hypothetical protein
MKHVFEAGENVFAGLCFDEKTVGVVGRPLYV